MIQKLINIISNKLNEDNIKYAFSGYFAYYYLHNHTDGPTPKYITIDGDKMQIYNAIKECTEINIIRTIHFGTLELCISFDIDKYVIRITNNKHRLYAKELIKIEEKSTYSAGDLYKHSLFDFISDTRESDHIYLILTNLPKEEPSELLVEILSNYNYKLATYANRLQTKSIILPYISKFRDESAIFILPD